MTSWPAAVCYCKKKAPKKCTPGKKLMHLYAANWTRT